MSTISFRRVCCFARYDWTVSWRTFLSQWLILSLTLALVQVLMFMGLWRGYEVLSKEGTWEYMVESCTSSYGYLAVLVLSIYLLVVAILFQYDYRQQQARLQMMLIPATMAEKFWVRMWRTWVIGLLVALLAYLSADFFRMIVEPLLSKGRIGYIALWPWTSETTPTNWSWMPTWITIILPIHAFCLLCGCFFRKHILGMTLLAIVAASLIVLILVYCMHPLLSPIIYAECEDTDLAVLIVRLISCAVALAQYYLAYRLFVNQQLLGRSLINI